MHIALSESKMGKEVLDTFFLIHGAPLVLIDDTLPARTFLKSWREKILPQRPTSVLVISGHWETTEPSVNVPHVHETIHDFEDFPAEMYQLQYPAPGAPELAKRVNEVLMAAGFKQVHEDKTRGLDHGSWVPLMQMYPEADIPVCQLSIQPHKDGTYHFNLGKALAPLREEGVLILGTGSVTHNMDTIRHPNDGSVAPWALEFDTWVKEALLSGRYDDVNHYLERGPHAKMAHPEPEHFYPLLAAIGAAGGEKAKAKLIHHSWSRHTISYANYQFTSAAA